MISLVLNKIFGCVVVIFAFMALPYSFGQGKPMYIYDLQTQQIDSMDIVYNDSHGYEDYTMHYLGSFNSEIEDLDLESPEVDVYPESTFTRKIKTSIDYDLVNFPTRTSLKIFKIENGDTLNHCSGSMISRKHALTATHCFIDLDSNNPSVDSFLVCPVYDNGEISTDFECSLVRRLIFIKDWKSAEEDIGIMELELPIGDKTGWIGIGFDNNFMNFQDKVFYKYSYPSQYLPVIDPIDYNGDTLYYSYGNINFINENYLGVNGAVAIPGESGSSLIQVDDEIFYSQGVLSYSSYIHPRIRDWMFYTFKELMKDDLILSTTEKGRIAGDLVSFENPVKDILDVKSNILNPIRVQVVDFNGNVLHDRHDVDSDFQVNVSNWSSGIYYLIIDSISGVTVRKVNKI